MSTMIAVDWGTSRFRGYLVRDSIITDQVTSDEGMAATARGTFATVFLKNCSDWLAKHPDAPITMAGMVGSRNGWMEVPYAPCPAGIEEIATRVGKVYVADGVFASIIPGLICSNDGMADVMRGEETLIIGSNVRDGMVIQPGTHSKWAVVRNGRVSGFRTFMTGEFFSLLTGHSILRLLATPKIDNAGFHRGLEAAAQRGGLAHLAFSARSRVLSGDMSGAEVEPYLSGLLIGLEVREAAAEMDGPLTLIADGFMAENYAAALAQYGLTAGIMAPQVCLVAGLAAISQFVR